MDWVQFFQSNLVVVEIELVFDFVDAELKLSSIYFNLNVRLTMQGSINLAWNSNAILIHFIVSFHLDAKV